MIEHKVNTTTRRGLFGGTLYVVHCLCEWECIATGPLAAKAFEFAHLEDSR